MPTLLTASLLLVFVALALASRTETSATFDETNHLVRGIHALATGEFVLNRDHPPLVNLLQAIPVMWLHRPAAAGAPVTSSAYPFFDYSRTVIWEGDALGPTRIQTARLVTIAIAVLGGMLVYRWSTRLYGTTGGLLSLAALMLLPSTLAHGALVTTDMGLAVAMTAYWYGVWRYLESPSRATMLFAAVALGCALSSKHFAWLNVPTTLIALAIANTVGSVPARLWCAVRVTALWTLGACLVVWACYGFEFSPLYAGGTAVPAPDYWSGLLGGWTHLTQGRVFYLDGVRSTVGWFRYFPLAFLYKTPWPFIVLAVLATIVHLTRRPSRSGLAISFALLTIVALIVCRRVNLGLRYWLFIYPFLAVMIGVVATAPRLSRWGLALLVLLATETYRGTPAYLAYFNPWIPDVEKRRHLVDSNLDWGQALPALARFQRAARITDLKLGYFGTAEPADYGVDAVLLPSFLSPRPDRPRARELTGTVAVSATLLEGLYMPDDFYASLRMRRPLAVIGDGAILVYDCRSTPGTRPCGAQAQPEAPSP